MRDLSNTATTALALRAVNRGVVMARLSSVVLIVLGGLSTLFSILNPFSLAFLVSIAVLAVGIIEWRMATALRALDEKSPGRLAVNQTTLGVVIAVYAVCQALAFDQAAIDEVLNRESTAQLLNLYPQDLVSKVREMLPRLVPLIYYGVGVVALLGCWATALFYRSRLRHVTLLQSSSQCP